MAQENDSELNTSFSTLNVNAMEFVPSFCTVPTAPTTEETPPPAAATAAVVAAVVPEEPTSTPATATTPTSTTAGEKTPENAGKYEWLYFAQTTCKKKSAVVSSACGKTALSILLYNFN